MSHVVPKPGIVQVAGSRGDGKTWLVLNMAVGLSAGVGIFGWTCEQAYRVLVVDGELPPWTLQERIKAVIADRKARPKRGSLHLLPMCVGDIEPINLSDPGQTDALVETFTNFDIVFLDNLSALTYGVDPNDARAWESVNTLSMRCRSKGTSIVRVQHLGKDKSKGGRGSSRQEDLLDVSLVIERQSPDTFHGSQVFRITCNKLRNRAMQDFKPVDLEFTTRKDGGIHIGHRPAYHNKTEELAVKVADLMQANKWEKTNKQSFAKEHEVARATLYNAVSKAKELIKERGSEDKV